MARPSAVSFYPTDHPALNIGSKSRIAAHMANMQVDLGSGLAADWADYRFRCGVIDGLKTAIAIIDEVMTEMEPR
jgi:hypothetical protein